jgi:hypothetical protein
MTIKQIAKIAFPKYEGRKFKADYSGEVTFRNTNWDGGTKSIYIAVRLDDSKSFDAKIPAPWLNPYEGRTLEIPEGFAVVENIIFCGKNIGLNVYMPIITPNQEIGGEIRAAIAKAEGR